MKPVMMTVAQFCECVGVKHTTANRLIRENKVESTTIGRRRLIAVRSAEALTGQEFFAQGGE